jgi:hypothetical protein
MKMAEPMEPQSSQRRFFCSLEKDKFSVPFGSSRREK